MNILVIPVQSVSDLITNSSSEVFILETGKTCEEVNTILNTFTSGFRYPEVFSLKDFREWRKKLRSGEIEDDWSYPGAIFSIVNGWFKDPEDEEDLLNLRMDFLFDPFDTIDYGNGYSSSYKEPIHDAFIEYLNKNWDKVAYDINRVLAEDAVSSIDWKTLRRHNYWLKDALEDVAKEFLKNYNGPEPTVWNVSKGEDVRRLDGKVLVVSNDDNSIPYDTWDKIRDLFNGWSTLRMKFRLQSLNDVVTNSSMEVYQEATQYTVNAVRDIINVILKISGSDKSCDDLFTISINYGDMLDSYFDDCLDRSDIDEEYLGMIEEVKNRKDDNGYISNSEAYKELVNMGIVGDVLPTIEEYVENFDCDWRYPSTEVSIVPKGEASPADVAILNKINDLFSVEACYN